MVLHDHKTEAKSHVFATTHELQMCQNISKAMRYDILINFVLYSSFSSVCPPFHILLIKCAFTQQEIKLRLSVLSHALLLFHKVFWRSGTICGVKDNCKLQEHANTVLSCIHPFEMYSPSFVTSFAQVGQQSTYKINYVYQADLKLSWNSCM